MAETSARGGVNASTIKDEFREKLKHVLIRSVRADTRCRTCRPRAKMNSDWKFLAMLRDRGRALATSGSPTTSSPWARALR
jgi:hypothetical protein